MRRLAAAAVVLGWALALPAGAAAPVQDSGTAPAVVWAVGDAATPTSAAARVAAAIRRARPDRFLYLGDVYETGTREDFERHYDPLYGRLASITDPTPGNHEWRNRHSGYYPYWRARKGHRQPPWFKTTLAGWELVSLNSEAPHDPASRQLRWLRRALSAPGDCRIAFWHRPRFSAGAVHGDAPDLAPLWDALRGHARVVLSGHDHDLQRLRPRNGIVQYVAGSGGRALYPLRKDRRLVWGDDASEGALRIVLEPGRATFEFRNVAGRLLDRSRRTCTPG